MQRLCVFCGSSPGYDPRFLEAARGLGHALAAAGIGLVYGGASVGLMGAVADAVLEKGGSVIGVIPEALVAKEVAHKSLPDLRVVASMHERKALMAELSDGFIALPGGIGTFEELFEVWTWAQLGHHQKPCAIYNVAGFYDGLATFLDGVVAAGFMKQNHRDMLVAADTADSLLAKLRAYEPPAVTKWIKAEER
ncbi:MAG: TIGR00730 family Rossman fold protein [Azospirillaceae bacterium]|nr:TIGR00730 family Rossman fold protein [Azospirillaceae bacterium]